MKKRLTQFTIHLGMLAIISSCSIIGVTGDFDLASNRTYSGRSDSINSEPIENSTKSPELSRMSPHGDKVLFEGIVFVASTTPFSKQWEAAGWKIAKNTETIDDNQVPQDCTLYPHRGVEGQWIGSCPGPTYIPTDGANHIAVMHTALDGSTSLVQVAPAED